MKRALIRMRRKGLYEVSRVVPAQTAQALAGRGLVEVKDTRPMNGHDCVLTDKGRAVATELPT